MIDLQQKICPLMRCKCADVDCIAKVNCYTIHSALEDNNNRYKKEVYCKHYEFFLATDIDGRRHG